MLSSPLSFSCPPARSRALLCFLLALSLAGSGCGLIRKAAINGMADSMSESSEVYARDEDPQLVGDAFPFLLKTIESLLVQVPENRELLVTACEAFTSYAQAFVAVPADRIEETDLQAAREQRERAGKLFVRARGYGLQALELRHRGISAGLDQNPDSALTGVEEKDLGAVFWTGAAWALAINNNKDDMRMVIDFNIANALLHRALELDPDWNDGAIHEVMITLETARPGAVPEESHRAARSHFEIAVDLSEGNKAGPYVSLAESVSIKEQNVEEFMILLDQALEVDIDANPDYRLSNVLAQRRARWLLDHIEDYFIEYEPEEDDS